MAKKISIPKDKIEDFCRRNRIAKLSLFGSVLRDDFTPGSDVDVLVEFEPTARVGFFELYDIEQELSSLLGGRKIDMNTPQGLSKYFRDKVMTTAEAQYVDRDPMIRLFHMRDYAAKIGTLIIGKNKANLEQDEVLCLAVTRLIELIGEAASQ